MDPLRPRERLDGPVTLVAADPRWPGLFATEGRRLHAVLGATALALEHVGSTSVPGLAAKPVIDILLAVPDSRDEAAYVPPLAPLGYVLAVREPDWHEHRLLRHEGPAVNLHVFSRGCGEVARMLAFRDRLRAAPADRRHYEDVKRALAARRWDHLQDYADAKSAVVGEILGGAARTKPTQA